MCGTPGSAAWGGRWCRPFEGGTRARRRPGTWATLAPTWRHRDAHAARPAGPGGSSPSGPLGRQLGKEGRPGDSKVAVTPSAQCPVMTLRAGAGLLSATVEPPAATGICAHIFPLSALNSESEFALKTPGKIYSPRINLVGTDTTPV